MTCYFDYNATAPLLPPVKEAMREALDYVGNGASIHRFGARVRHHVEAARHEIAAYLEADPKHVVFTSSGSEANNLALQGVKHYNPDAHIFVGATEHPSILNVFPGAVRIPVYESGLINQEALEILLQQTSGPKLISTMRVQNETGVVQPIREIADLVHRYDGLMHTDVIQGVGKLPTSMKELGVDMMTVGCHKMGGPSGIGALIIKDTVPIAPLIRGGGQEQNRRAGTLNAGLVMGFAASLRSCSDLSYLRCYHDQLEKKLRAIDPAVIVFGFDAPRACNTTCVSMPGVASHTQVMSFDLQGIAVSAGSACSSGKVTSSHVLTAMGYAKEMAGTSLRISSGWQTTASDFDRVVDVWTAIYNQHHKVTERRP